MTLFVSPALHAHSRSVERASDSEASCASHPLVHSLNPRRTWAAPSFPILITCFQGGLSFRTSCSEALTRHSTARAEDADAGEPAPPARSWAEMPVVSIAARLPSPPRRSRGRAGTSRVEPPPVGEHILSVQLGALLTPSAVRPTKRSARRCRPAGWRPGGPTWAAGKLR